MKMVFELILENMLGSKCWVSLSGRHARKRKQHLQKSGGGSVSGVCEEQRGGQ